MVKASGTLAIAAAVILLAGCGRKAPEAPVPQTVAEKKTPAARTTPPSIPLPMEMDDSANELVHPTKVMAPAQAPASAPTPEPTKMEGLLQHVLNSTGGERETALGSLQRELEAANDPQLWRKVGREFCEQYRSYAMLWASQLAGTSGGPDLAAGVAEAITPPRTGLSWASAIPHTRARGHAMGVIICQLADTSPSEAAVWVLRMPEGEDRDLTSAIVFGKWAGKDQAAAIEWLQGRKVVFGGEALGVFVSTWASIAPEQAADWALKISSAPARDGAIAEVLAVWFEKDQAAAGQWITKNVRSKMPATVQTVTDHWKDRAALQAWVKGLKAP